MPSGFFRSKTQSNRSFPEGRGRVDAVANAINTELKIAALLSLDNYPKTSTKIRSVYAENFGPDIWIPRESAFKEDCKTLVDKGLVEEEEFGIKSQRKVYTGYMISEVGDFFRPLFLYALDFAQNRGISLRQLLGKSSSRGETTGPRNRLRILESLGLGSSNSMRVVDISELLDLPTDSVSAHLKTFSELGIVHFDSISGETPEKYVVRWVNGSFEQTFVNSTVGSYQRSSARDVARFIHEKKKSPIQEVISGTLHEPWFVGEVVRRLERKGFVKRDYISSETMSHTWLLHQDYRKFAQEIIRASTTLDSHLVDDFRRRTNLSSVGLRELVRKGIDNYRPYSGSSNRTAQEREDLIISTLMVKGPMRPRDLRIELGYKSPGLSSYLRKMADEGKLLRSMGKENKTAVYYEVNLSHDS